MNPHNDTREQRWLAYYLGELPEAERRQIELELEADPALAADMQDFIKGIASWARQPVQGRPVDIDTLRHGHAVSNGLRMVRWPLTAAAAALFLFALTQVQFSLEFAGTTFAWGISPATDTEVVAELQARLADLEAEQASTQSAVETVAMQTLALEENLNTTAATLAVAQQQEAVARYRDMEQLMVFAASSDDIVMGWD